MNQTTDSGADPVTRQLALLENEGEPGLRSDFSDDEVLKSSQNYLGEFKADHYLVIKDHLEIPNSESFLYHTRYIPKETPVASMAIIHGFGDHSYRHLPVKTLLWKSFWVSMTARGIHCRTQLRSPFDWLEGLWILIWIPKRHEFDWNAQGCRDTPESHQTRSPLVPHGAQHGLRHFIFAPRNESRSQCGWSHFLVWTVLNARRARNALCQAPFSEAAQQGPRSNPILEYLLIPGSLCG